MALAFSRSQSTLILCDSHKARRGSDELIRTTKTRGKIPVVWEIILDGCRGITALDVELRFKHPLRQQLTIHATHGSTGHFGEEKSPTLLTLGARTGSRGENRRFAAQHHDVLCRIQAAGIRFAVDRLAIVTMAHVLQDCCASDLHLHRTAGTLNMCCCHWHRAYARSGTGQAWTSRPGAALKPTAQMTKPPRSCDLGGFD